MSSILQILPCLTMGGAENLVKEYLLHLQPEEDVELLCLGEHVGTALETTLDKQAKVTYMGESFRLPAHCPAKLKNGLRSIRWRIWLSNYLKRTSPRVIHCHLSGAHELSCVKRSLKGIKLFYTIHTDPAVLWGNEQARRETRAIERLVKECGMELIVLHEQMKADIQRYVPACARIHVLNNAVDFSRIRNPRMSKNDVRRMLGIPDGSFIIGHIGRFSEPKNHGFLLEVFHAYHCRNNRAELVLVGDGPLKETIRNRAEYLGISENVHFLGNRSDIPELLQTFDLFLFPSLWEGFPMTLIEAQAAGVPCLVSERITKEVCLTNLIQSCPLRCSPEEWAQAIQDRTTEAYQEFGLNAYDISKVIGSLKQIYGLDGSGSSYAAEK